MKAAGVSVDKRNKLKIRVQGHLLGIETILQDTSVVALDVDD